MYYQSLFKLVENGFEFLLNLIIMHGQGRRKSINVGYFLSLSSEFNLVKKFFFIYYTNYSDKFLL